MEAPFPFYFIYKEEAVLASERLVICQKCREKFSRSKHEYEKTSKGFFHKKCYLDQEKEKETRQSIVEYLEKLFPDKVNYPLVYKQIKEFTEKYPYTESGLLGTLHFVVEIKRIGLTPNGGIGLLPYYYNDAKEYYLKLSKMKNIDKVENKEKLVLVRPKKSRKLNSLIDIENLLGDD